MNGLTEAQYLAHRAELKRLQVGAKQFRDRKRIFAKYLAKHEIDWATWHDAQRGIFADKMVYDYDKRLVRELRERGEQLPGVRDDAGRHVRLSGIESTTPRTEHPTADLMEEEEW